ncbi:hypothetical protein QQF64_011240, partial [Cirrhinus molitorella]
MTNEPVPRRNPCMHVPAMKYTMEDDAVESEGVEESPCTTK